GKKSEGVLTGADDGEAISQGVYDAYTKLNLRYSQLAPHVGGEEHRHQPARADRALLDSDHSGTGRER
ncbi:MAG: fumarate hydratase, partial [Marmoricola sp.]